MTHLAPAALAALLALAACSTDNKVADASAADASAADASAADASAADGASASDAGALVQNTLDAGLGDGGVIDPSPPVPDAGVQPQETTVASTSAGGGVAPTGAPTGTSSSGKGTPYDRILAKPKAQGGDVDALKAAVEKKTGHKLALVRRTAGKWLLLQFAPTAKGRTEGDQKSLVDALKSMDEFASVEGDRLMKVKQP